MPEFDTALEDDFAEPDAETLRFDVTGSDTGRRLDSTAAAVAKERDVALSRSRIQSLIADGMVAIDGTPVLDANRKLKAGEVVTLVVPPPEDPEPAGEAIALAIVHEDAHLLVIDKPAGLVVHPAAGHASGTLVNALIAHCGDSLSGIGGVRRPGIVHRLDKDTSGLLVVAKSDRAHQGLARLFADHGRTLPLARAYVAFVWGVPERTFGTIEAPLGRHPTDRLRMAVVPEERGRHAVTHWRRERVFAGQAARIACELETGRTHQIRVHMAHAGHPVLGDPLYARGFRSKTPRLPAAAQQRLATLGRQALHAAHLGFEHPVTGAYLEFDSALPDDLAALDAALADDQP